MHFDAFDTPLRPGSSLIEASAGTGKTYTIAMLVTRLVVEHGLMPEQIIVTTFTRAATAELKERIRRRLYEALHVARGNSQRVEDTRLVSWYHSLSAQCRDQAADCLEAASRQLDNAAIFTMHGFCQRVLTDYALESRQPFDMTLLEDDRAALHQVSEDFWRRRLYQAHPWLAAIIQQCFETPDSLLNKVADAYNVDIVHPEADSLPEVGGEDIQARCEHIQARFQAVFAPLLDTSEFSSYLNKGCLEGLRALCGQPEKWLQTACVWHATYAGIDAGLNRKKLNSEAKRERFIARWGLELEEFEAYYHFIDKAVSHIILRLRLDLLAALKEQVPELLQSRNECGFDELVTALAAAIRQGNKALLGGLRQQYGAALIDEFQDTDPHQWQIFAGLFEGSTAHYLYLIGDPKQAIYKFRGADIYTYFQAADQVSRRYALGYNWRSHPAMVAAVNTLFARRSAPFVLEQLHYEAVKAARSEQAGTLVDQAGEALAACQFWVSTNRSLLCDQIGDEIVALLHGSARLHTEHSERALGAADIAILTASNEQARQYERALRQRHIPVTLSRSQSVFISDDMPVLRDVLRAVCQPRQLSCLKQLLIHDWFGIDGPTYIQAYLHSENGLDALAQRFHEYCQLWQTHGLMPMMTTLLEHEGVQDNLMASAHYERRLTDLFHALELMQQAIAEERLGMHQSIEWLNRQMQQARDRYAAMAPAAQRMRLDCDRETVTIMTMHAAKGLEFPVVFCPDLCRGIGAEQKSDRAPLVSFNEPGQGRAVDFGSARFSEHQQLARRESLGEHMRLMYVALTRARYRCYVVWKCPGKQGRPPETSALGYLLDMAPNSPAEAVEAVLEELVQQSPAQFCWQRLPEQAVPPAQLVTTPPALQTLSLMPVTEAMLAKMQHDPWQMTSYTALAHQQLTAQPTGTEMEKHGVAASDEQAGADVPEPIPAQAGEVLPGGMQTGNAIHLILEQCRFTDLATAGQHDAQSATGTRIIQAMQRYGLEETCQQVLCTLLENVVTTPLDQASPALTLAGLDEAELIREMPFYLYLPDSQLGHINHILSRQPGFQPLANRHIAGYLTGAMDLVFRYQGRYYIVDYKSNTLESYDQAALAAAMHTHNYGLQLWLYTLALHRFLRQTVADYDYQRHFGGVYYLFVRGLNGQQDTGGIYYTRPSRDILEKLDTLLTGELSGEQYHE